MPEGRPSPGTQLRYCVIYLAPGDYHRIHSPAAMKIKSRRHFPGTLFPVAPKVRGTHPRFRSSKAGSVRVGAG